jgi:hypothetical protein
LFEKSRQHFEVEGTALLSLKTSDKIGVLSTELGESAKTDDYGKFAKQTFSSTFVTIITNRSKQAIPHRLKLPIGGEKNK